MKNKKIFNKLIVFFAMSTGIGALAQTENERAKITSGYDKQKMSELLTQSLKKEQEQKKFALEFARTKNFPITLKLSDGGLAEIQKIVNGKPIYYRTFNVAAAKSTRTNHINSGGSLGLSLDGQNMIAYVWDGGHARVTHQEYDGAGGTNRVSVEDATSEGGTKLNFHAAHVTGTICASGFTANAKGMAWQAKVRGYMWNNDLSEATTAASNGMLVSNHSYGYRSKDDFGNNILPNYYPGAYITDSKDWDNLMFNAPNYLMVVAAGNDGGSAITDSPLASGYDKLTGHATCKNNMVVANAQDANIDTNGNLVSVAINSSSSQGPTDDLRIKPDITGNGTGVYSTYESSDTAYASITGTSMASPNVTGTLLLLQQHYNNTKGTFMRAATLKGLALHTADDAGTAGPDAVFGWGLLNAKRAAETITKNGTSSLISELTLQAGQTYTLNVNSDGVNKLMASISWTDRAGTATTALNSNTAILVNDLDIRITKSGTTYFPWRLTGVTTNGLGDNTKDPYERVDVSGASGQYTITITHKGTLTGSSQNYTLIVTGVTNSTSCVATVPTGLGTTNVTSTGVTVNWNAVAGATYEVRYKATASTTWNTVAASTNTVSLSGLLAATAYEVQVRSLCSGGTSSAFSSSVNFTTSTSSDTIAPTAPTLTAAGTTSTSTNLSWSGATDNIGVTGYDVYRGTTFLASVTGTTYTATGLTPSTTYSFTVRAKDGAGNVSAASNAVSVTTTGTSLMYCASNGNNSSYEWIDYVALNGMINTTGSNGGYGNFTSKVAPLPYGSNTIYFSAGFSSSAYTEYWSIWIDYNKNGTFESTEKVVAGSSASSGTLSATFTVPTTALAGQTRMRVQMKYSATSTACETFTYGEVEDYTVNIGSSGPAINIIAGQEIGNDSNVYDFSMYPVPAENTLNVSLFDSRKVSYKVYNLMGQAILGGELTHPEINVSKLPAGVYVIDVNDGQKSITKKFTKK
ncbi:MAG: S8 family serine peptidase [Limnohabitans sp.]|nr:S8 family serine peptidase [Limnohabitans sp.]